MVLFDLEPREYSIIVIKGKMFARNLDDLTDKPALTELPRLLIIEVEPKLVGEPIPYFKAIQKGKYDDILSKYPEDFFIIPYT